MIYEFVLAAVGRTSNGNRIGAERAGVVVGDRGFINADKQMRTNVGHIFAACDIIGQPMLAHKAVPKVVLEKSILPLIPIGRLGEPEEIARAVVFLVADEAGAITGATLLTNGGQYMV